MRTLFHKPSLCEQGIVQSVRKFYPLSLFTLSTAYGVDMDFRYLFGLPPTTTVWTVMSGGMWDGGTTTIVDVGDSFGSCMSTSNSCSIIPQNLIVFKPIQGNRKLNLLTHAICSTNSMPRWRSHPPEITLPLRNGRYCDYAKIPWDLKILWRICGAGSHPVRKPVVLGRSYQTISSRIWLRFWHYLASKWQNNS